MFLNKDSLQVKVGNGNWIKLGDYIVEAKYGFNKLWSSDSGRNLAGVQSGTLIGIFPKIVCQFRKLNQSDMETIAPILDSAKQKIKYYDPKKRATETIDTYTGDYEYRNKTMINNGRKNDGFSCSFIAIRKRS